MIIDISNDEAKLLEAFLSQAEVYMSDDDNYEFYEDLEGQGFDDAEEEMGKVHERVTDQIKEGLKS